MTINGCASYVIPRTNQSRPKRRGLEQTVEAVEAQERVLLRLEERERDREHRREA